MGGMGSRERGLAQEDTKMDEGAGGSLDNLGETKLGSLRVKDPDAWKGSPSTRPRSALKHGSSSLSCADSEASGSTAERSPSGRRMNRKVSFQVQGLAPPLEVQEAQEAAGEEGNTGSHAHKRVRGSEEFSMKFLVDKFYARILELEPLKPFFDGVDLFKLKYQQEALMLLVFGGHELLEDELPGMSADLRLIHLHLLFEGLNLTHWQLFAETFTETLDELHQIPDDVKQRAKSYMASTEHYFRPIEADEWPPKVVYKGWTKRSCPFHTSFKRPADPAEADEKGADVADVVEADAAGSTADDEFTLPGFSGSPKTLLPSPLLPAASAAPGGSGAEAGAGAAPTTGAADGEAAAAQ